MYRFMTTFSPLDNIRTVRTGKAIAAVDVSVTERSQQLGLFPSTTLRILRKDLGLHPYKIRLLLRFNT